MDIKKRLIAYIVPRVGFLLTWILYGLNKNRFFLHENLENENILICFWHGEMLMMPFLYRRLRSKPNTHNVHIISSSHFDGGLIASMCELFGMKTIRGSTDVGGKKGGVLALMQSIKALKNGADIGIAMDGPRGPYHHIADGLIMMAQKSGKKISLCRIVPSRFYEFKTWDRFCLPIPFGEICYYGFEGFRLDSSLSIEEARQVLKQKVAQIDEILKNPTQNPQAQNPRKKGFRPNLS